MGKRSRILITTTLLNLGFAICEKEGQRERERELVVFHGRRIAIVHDIAIYRKANMYLTMMHKIIMPVTARNSALAAKAWCSSTRSNRRDAEGVRKSSAGSEWTKGCKRKDAASTPPPDISSPGSYVCHEF